MHIRQSQSPNLSLPQFPFRKVENHKFVFYLCDSTLLSSFQIVVLCFHLVLEFITFFFKEPGTNK